MDYDKMPCIDTMCKDCDFWRVDIDGQDGYCILTVDAVE